MCERRKYESALALPPAPDPMKEKDMTKRDWDRQYFAWADSIKALADDIECLNALSRWRIISVRMSYASGSPSFRFKVDLSAA